MSNKKDFHVVDKNEKLNINAAEIYTQSNKKNNNAGKKKAHRKMKGKKGLILIIIILAFIGTGIFFTRYYTYHEFKILETHEDKKIESNNFGRFGEGILKYNTDGVMYINSQGDEIWNYSYQMKNPELTFYYNECGAVVDKGGNQIFVFDQEGSKGSIKTNLPIEKATVSSQGIVSAILRNEPAPKIITYDLAGNVLVEFKTSLLGTGYPMDLTVSEDGKTLVVSYMYVENGMVSSRLNFYDFSKKKESGKDYEALKANYKDTLIPETFFMDNHIMAAVGNRGIYLYEGEKKPVLREKIKIKEEIKSVFHNKKYIGVIVKKENASLNEVRLYDTSGKKIMSSEFEGEVVDAAIEKGQVIAHSGKECRIFNKAGTCLFSGEAEKEIIEIYPAKGVNKYVLISSDGGHIVRLSK